MQGGIGLGDTAQSACGLNPCGFWDYIYASDACVNYRLCVNPSDPTALLESQGLIAGAGSIIGGTTAQTAQNLISGVFTDPVTGGLNITTLIIAGMVLYFMAKK